MCLITGASQGMGRAAAIEMARQGAAAVAWWTFSEAGEETAALVREQGAKGIFIPCDLRQRDEIAAAVESAVGQFGGLDVLLNNAGVLERAFTTMLISTRLPKTCGTC
jgi:NAD(P)-dependent dehydrogenase (short-subunit alcohol dehydrogenase family)